jgi:protein-L-isoaspartate(D-aspartate) O-methyltransferase
MNSIFKNNSRIWQNYAEKVLLDAAIMDEQLEEKLYQILSSVPRNLFLPSKYASRSSDNISIPIGYNQESWVPSFIVRCIGLLALKPNQKVLQIGCGSGYSSVLMSMLGASVYALEIEGLLAQQTRKNLDLLNFQNILIRRMDGTYGWSDQAPYDAVIATCQLTQLPEEIYKQLNPISSKIVAPINNKLTFTEISNGKYKKYDLEYCNFN